MLTPSVKALFKHPIKIPIKYSECAGNLGAPVGIDSCHGQKGRLARRFHVLASEIVGLCNTGLWPHPPTCPLSFARRQLSSRPCKAKTRRFDSRFRNRARDRAERALGCNDSKVAATPSPEVFRPLMRAVDASKHHHCIYEGVPSGIGPACCGLSGQTAAQTLLTLA